MGHTTARVGWWRARGGGAVLMHNDDGEALAMVERSQTRGSRGTQREDPRGFLYPWVRGQRGSLRRAEAATVGPDGGVGR